MGATHLQWFDGGRVDKKATAEGEITRQSFKCSVMDDGRPCLSPLESPFRVALGPALPNPDRQGGSSRGGSLLHPSQSCIGAGLL